MCHPSLIEGMSLRCCQQVNIMVISSLNAQMYDQIAKLNERGISACMIQRHRMVSWFTAKEMTLSRLRMCSYWLRTWRPIKKTPYVILYWFSFKIILCMLILCGNTRSCPWVFKQAVVIPC